jgi:hyaluronan synthase
MEEKKKKGKKIIGLYGILLFLYLGFQIWFAIKESKKQKNLKKVHETPFVSILVPFYNEKPQEIIDTIWSLVALEYPAFEILVMDDGSKTTESYDALIREFGDSDKLVRIFRQSNAGKREAQVSLSLVAAPETKYFLTVDSDSILDPGCLMEMVRIASEFGAKAVSGGIMPKKGNDLLNLLLRIRYWSANWQERLSQSYFGQVNCCSGPCSLWDAEIFYKVCEKYVSQTFLGKKCTYGDDRHLTNLYIEEGADIRMASNAMCQTATPDSWQKWFKQQLRWSKSFYRESWYSATKVRGKMKPYSIFMNVMAFMLPLLLLVNIYRVIRGHKVNWKLYFGSVLCVGFIRGAYAFWCTRDWTYFLSPVYGVIHFLIVFPIRVYALFRLKDTSWGTR